MFFYLHRRIGAAGVALALALGSFVGAVATAYATTSAAWVSSVSPAAGKVAGGTRITVNGLHFWHVRAVLFGTTPGTNVRILSSTRLQVTAPAHGCGIVHVRVRTTVGTSPTHSTDRYTYIAPPRISSMTPNTGSTSGGVRLTIRGSSFVRVTKVLLGSSLGISIRTLSTSSLQVTAPAHTASTVGIRVQTPYGTSAPVAADAFQYIAPPTITSLTPAQGPISGGAAVTITGSGLVDATNVTFGTTPATSFTVGANKDIVATAPEHAAGSVDVRVTTPYGISSASTGDRYTYIGPPTVSYIADPASGETTGGTTAHIYGTNFVGTPSVTFDGIPATNVSVFNSTRVDATAPAHPEGVVDVRVTTAYGMSALSAGDQYRYRPAPSITLGSPTVVDPTRGGGFPQSISCPSTTFCLSADRLGNVFTFNGSSWTAPSRTAPAGLQYVSCPTPDLCAAYGHNGEAATFSAGSWSTTSRIDPSGQQPQGLSCPSATFCAAVDYSGDAITFNPNTLAVLSNDFVVGGEHLQAVSCTSPSFCVAVAYATAFVYNGFSWSAGTQITPNAGPYLANVSCAGSTFCVAVDEHGGALTFNGSAWSAPTVVDTQSLTAVSCVSQTACVAIDKGGNVSSFDGSTWSTPSQGHDWNSSWAISCSTATFCGAVSGWGDAETFDGTHTTYAHDVDSPNNVSAVSCPSTTFCAAVDMSGSALTFNGTTWTTPSMVDNAGELVSVSCVSAIFCAATDVHGNALTFDGAHWSTPDNVAGSGPYFGKVSCASTSFCIATGAAGSVTEYTGAGWSSPIQIDSRSLQDVSCPTTTFCMATDEVGHYALFDGTSWTAPATATTYGVFAVSCTSPTFCGATGNSLGAAVYNGSSWAADNNAGRLGDVACTSPSFCVSANGGYLSTYDGNVWSMQVYEPPLGSAFSCATPTFCMFFAGGSVILGQ